MANDKETLDEAIARIARRFAGYDLRPIEAALREMAEWAYRDAASFSRNTDEFTCQEMERRAAAIRAELEHVKQERDEAQRAKYGSPCKCESWMETCRLAEERAKAAESRELRLREALEKILRESEARDFRGDYSHYEVGQIARQALGGK